jgi:5-methylcytosine-specific restriction protein A
MPIKLCLSPKCPNPATARGRCDFHRKLQERQRSRVRRQEGRERNRFYARKHWAMVRRHKLRLDPICELCDVALASEVHHRIALDDGGDVYAMGNLVSTCKPCHSRQTRREQVGRAAGDDPAVG